METPSAVVVAGVWQRQWEQDPLGDEEGADRDTLVLWTQTTSGVYVDIRIRKSSPGRSIEAARQWGKLYAGALASNGNFLFTPNDPKHLLTILSQKSFAGVLNFQLGDTSSGRALEKDSELRELAACQDPQAIPLCTCFWRRDLDYQPPSGGLDIGICASGPPASDGSILLRETGDDASYAEGWLRLAGTEKGPFLALKLVAENGHANARDGYWVRAGNRFAYAVGRPKTSEAANLLGCPEASTAIKDCVGKDLAQAIKSISTDPQEILKIAFSYVAVAGEIDSDGSWRVHHSTNPELVGCHLVGDPEKDEACCSRLVAVSGEAKTVNRQVDQVIPSEHGNITRRWQIVEQVDCDFP